LSTDLRIGSHIGGYAVESLLGRGGMSTVYLAEDPKLGRKVALKVMAEELAENDSFRTRFVREAQMAANLEHPSIVPVYDAGDAEGILYLAMRVIRGTDLRRVITEGGPMDPDRALGILRQVASALDAAHRAGLVHRDVKPANVLISVEGDDEHAYLTDFGLTKHVASRSGLTRTGQFMGTIDYVAPEQIRGNEVDGRTDLYSLGCVAYECITGTVPFSKDQDVAILFAHLEDERPKITDLRPDLPAAIDEVVATAMARLPDDRYGSCLAFIAAAREALGISASRGSSEPVVPAGTVFAAPPAPAVLEPHPSFPPREPSVPPAGTSVPAAASTVQAGTADPEAVVSLPTADPSIPPLAIDQDVVPAHQTASAVTEEVRTPDLPSAVTGEVRTPDLPPAVPPPPVAPQAAPPRRGDAAPRRALVVAAIVGIVAIVGVVGTLALAGGGDEPEPQPPVTPTQAPSPTQTQAPSPTASPSQSPSPVDEVDIAPVRAPLKVQRAAATTSSVTLTWSRAPNGGKAVRFLIFRDGERVGQTPNTRFVDDDLPASTTFVYQVVAVGADGSTAESGEVSLSTLAPASTGGSSGGSGGGSGGGDCNLLEELAGEC
jgi:serine/threonine-protein kinase